MRLPPAWLVVLSGVVIAMHVGKMPPAIPVLQQALGVTLVQAGFLLSAVQLAGMCLGLWSTYMGTGIALALLAGPLAMQALGWQGWWGLLGLLSVRLPARKNPPVPARCTGGFFKPNRPLKRSGQAQAALKSGAITPA